MITLSLLGLASSDVVDSLGVTLAGPHSNNVHMVKVALALIIFAYTIMLMA
jgi:hypothetical protein